jgi:hypothetical protein
MRCGLLCTYFGTKLTAIRYLKPTVQALVNFAVLTFTKQRTSLFTKIIPVTMKAYHNRAA